MVGLDPHAARLVKDMFREHAAKGGTVFLSTHSLEVAEEVCDRLAIIKAGQVLAQGTMAELRTQAGQEATLESIFLSLTGDEDVQVALRGLRSGP
jgi:ABC-2 type transport system ATP-binding protein